MIRILMTTDTLGGVWTYSLELAKELAQYPVSIALATMGKALSSEQRQAAQTIPRLEIYESSYRLEWMDEPWEDVKNAGTWLLQLENEVKPDVIHLNNFCHGALPWSAPTLMVAHSDVVSWFHSVKHEAPPSHWNQYFTEVTAGLNSSQVVIAPSSAVAADLRRFYDLKSDVRVIPNGRNPFLFRPLPKEPYILSVGRAWDEAKNISMLDQIGSKLEYPILLAGNTQSPDGLPSYFKSLQVLGEISREQLANYLGRASIYALPAKYEPFGLSILEAALSGCALVLGKIPSLLENWEDAALFVEPDQPHELLKTLKLLIHESELRQTLGLQAQRRARKFTSHRMAAAYFHEYTRLSRPELPLSQEQFIPTAKEL